VNICVKKRPYCKVSMGTLASGVDERGRKERIRLTVTRWLSNNSMKERVAHAPILPPIPFTEWYDTQCLTSLSALWNRREKRK
jgi:hypothetical protein